MNLPHFSALPLFQYTKSICLFHTYAKPGTSGKGRWQLIHHAIKIIQHDPVFSSHASSGIRFFIIAANEGIGAAILPCVIGEREPSLQRATLPFKEISELWILTRADLRQTARVKALMEHLHACLGEEKDILEGNI